MNVPVVKDDAAQQPVPTAWRPVLRGLVGALARGDAHPEADVPGVAPLSPDAVAAIYQNVRSYGATLVELPDETWQSSVCMWYGSHWEVLVDLWTAQEGHSDLVLGLRVHESGDGFAFDVCLVYVP